MRTLILTLGTRGDVQPYVALGKGLSAAGHSVTICTCTPFETLVTSHGLGYAFMNDDLIQFMHSDDGKMAMERTGNWWQALRTGMKLLPKVGAMQRRQIHDLWESTKAVDPDLILFHPKALGASDFAERLNVPCVFAFYLPMYVPTGDFSAMGIPDLKLGRRYNRLTYRVIDLATRSATGKYAREWRREHGLPSKRRGRFLERTNGDPIPALHAYSPSVIPRPSDWPETADVTGYWFLDRNDGWRPDADLEAFLSSGEPPVYFGFGSIFGRDPAGLTRVILDAIRKTGSRAIIARGWGGLDPESFDLPGTVLKIDSAPHDWLFPRVSAVVHHGGCGTTAAGLRAGRPTLVCPLFGDQPFWGRKIQSLGAGPAPIPQKRLTVESLSSALHELTTDASIRAKADSLGQKIRSEDGVANAVDFIDRWLSRRRQR
ncbi:MAG: glycosyltransferase [Acidobacteriota bacterium]